MIQRLMKRTGYREQVVRFFLEQQRTVMREALTQGEEVYFPALFRVIPTEREMWVQSPSSARRKVRRVILSTRPTQTFRANLNKWSEAHMDKYGVVTSPQDTKVGASVCPSCGCSDVKMRGDLPWCPNCGTAPWEPKENDAPSKEEA